MSGEFFQFTTDAITRAFSMGCCVKVLVSRNNKIHFMVEHIDEVIFILKVLV